MGAWVQDLQYASRAALKNSTLTAVIIVTLGLGIGANTAIFSVVDAVVLKPLPYRDPSRLVVFDETLQSSGRGAIHVGLSLPELADLQTQTDAFSEVSGFASGSVTMTGAGDPERLAVGRATSGFFHTIEIGPLLGRLLDQADDRPGADPVAVLTYRFWERHFNGSPQAIGQSLTLDGSSYTVVGVLPAGFRFPLRVSEAELFTPVPCDNYNQRGMHALTAIGRLKLGISREQAQVQSDALAGRLAKEYPDYEPGCDIRVQSLHEQLVRNTRPLMLLLLGAVGLVLLIACANITNLLLIRGADRRKELAVRAALGAGRVRMIRQLLTESILLSAVGGALGLAMAFWARDVLAAVLPQDVPRGDEIAIDARVLAFTFAVSVFTGLLFGLPPALRGVRVDLHSALKAGGGTTTTGRQRFQRLLVAMEAALALVLLVGAGLLVRSFQRVTDVEPGFSTDNILTFRTVIFNSTNAGLRQEMLERLSALPGVRSVGISDGRLLAEPGSGTSFTIVGHAKRDPAAAPYCRYCGVNPAYFSTLGIPLLRGQWFTDRDALDGADVAVINEAMARQFPLDVDPLGQRIAAGMRINGRDAVFEVVGIVGDVRDLALDIDPQPYLYVPYTRDPGGYVSVALRTRGDPLRLVGAVRREMTALIPDQAAFAFATADELLSDSLAPRRFPMVLWGAFAGMALALAATGMYGIVSYTVAQRKHEIAVHMALGAQPTDVLCLALRRGLALAIVGLGIGLVLSLAGTRLLSGFLFGVSATDPLTFLGTSLLLIVVALLASYLPARRATKVDPMVALRCE